MIYSLFIPTGIHQIWEKILFLNAPLHQKRINDDLFKQVVADKIPVKQVPFNSGFAFENGHIQKQSQN